MLKIIRHLLPLFVVQFFTWLGLFSLWIYATPVITRYVFNTVNAESGDFENGTTWVGICFAFYSTLAAFLVFMIPVLSKKIAKEYTSCPRLQAADQILIFLSGRLLAS